MKGSKILLLPTTAARIPTRSLDLNNRLIKASSAWLSLVNGHSSRTSVYKNSKYSAALDEKLHNTTYAMIAVPLYFLSQVRGVISCVQLFDVLVQQGEPVPVENSAGF